MLAYIRICLTDTYIIIHFKEKGGIFMMNNIHVDNIENEAALILAMCYGIRTEVAIKIAHCNGNRKQMREIVEKEIKSFFSEKYEVIKQIFIDYAENDMSVNQLSEKYELSKKTIRRYLELCDIYYMEFRGFIELGMLEYEADKNLMPFLVRYGRFFIKTEKKTQENYEFYQSFLNGEITKENLCYVTHMTPKTLCQL